MYPELSPAPWKNQPDASRQVCLILKTNYSTSNIRSPCKNMYRYSRRRGNLCPRAEKAVSRRRGKITFIRCRRKICRFSRRRGKLCPGAGKVVSRRPGKRTFIHYRRKNYISFPGAGGSCVPAPGKLFPGAGESCVPAPGVGERLAGRRLV